MSSEGFLEIDRCVALRERSPRPKGRRRFAAAILRFAQNDTEVSELWNLASYS
jgi:hypothetical protein